MVQQYTETQGVEHIEDKKPEPGNKWTALGTTGNDTIVNNHLNTGTWMIGGDGDDTYVIENIAKSWTDVVDGNIAHDDGDFYPYDAADNAPFSGKTGRDDGATNPGNDKLVLKNINVNDYILFFDIAVKEDINNVETLPDDALFIIKKSEINYVLNTDNPTKGGLQIPYYFGNTNNESNGEYGKEFGSNYIKTIQIDNNGVVATLDVKGYIEKIRPLVKEFLTKNGFSVSAIEVISGQGNSKQINELMNIYKNATIDLVIEGTEAGDIIKGEQGNDTIVGGKGDDKLYGGKGKNTFVFKNGDGIDTVYYQNGEDIIDLTGTDLLYDPDANDFLTYKDKNDLVIKYNDEADQIRLADYFKSKGKSNIQLKLNLIDGKNTTTIGLDKVYVDGDYSEETKGKNIPGTFLNDEIDGTQGNDVIKGGSGNDIITGNKGNDKLYGEAGNNEFYFTTGDGQDMIYQTKGATDTINFTDDEVGIKFEDLKFGAEGNNLVIKYSDTDKITIVNYLKNKFAGKDELNSVKTVITTDESGKTVSTNILDHLNSPDFKFETYGTAGKRNTLKGTAGNDKITGAELADNIIGNAGDDELYGEAGNDVIKGGAGNDTICGGTGNDKLYGEAGNNTFVFSTGDGQDTIYQAKGANDTIDFSKDNTIKLNELKIGAKGNDLIITYGKEHTDSVTISGYLKNYQKNPAANSVKSIVTADGEIKDLLAHITSDSFKFETYGIKDKRNNLKGTALGDVLKGGDLNDTLNGADGNDELYGEGGNDVIKGGKGDDIIYGGTGNDKLYGEAGNNTFVFSTGDGQDTIYQAKGANDTLKFAGFKSYDDAKMSFSAKGNNLIINYGEGDTITVNAFLNNYAKNPALNSVQKIQFGDSEAVTLESLIKAHPFVIEGTSGKKNNLKGSALDDILIGKELNDTLNGGAGNDKLYGGAGNDVIKGGAGDDVIYGEAGNDKLYGEAGRNTYYFKEGDGKDTIYMNAKGTDTIVLDSSLENTVTFDKAGNNLIVNYGTKGDSITIANYLNSKAPSVKNIVFADYDTPSTNFKTDEGWSLSEIVTKKDRNEKIPSFGDLQNVNVGFYEGNKYNNLIVSTDRNSIINAGAGDDTIYLQSKRTEVYGEAGDDTYVVSSLGNVTIIEDSEGNDTLRILDSAKNIKLLFNIQIDDKGNIVDQGGEDAFDELLIANNSTINKIKSKGFSAFNNELPGVTIEDFSNAKIGTSVQRIESKDGYYLGTEQLNALRNDVAAWLAKTDYKSAMEVLADGSKDDINSLLAVYQIGATENTQWMK